MGLILVMMATQMFLDGVRMWMKGNALTLRRVSASPYPAYGVDMCSFVGPVSASATGQSAP